MYTVVSEKANETQLRRRAKKLDCYLRKSRVKNIHADNLGGWQIIYEPLGCIVWGNRWELSLVDVESYLLDEEQRNT